MNSPQENTLRPSGVADLIASFQRLNAIHAPNSLFIAQFDGPRTSGAVIRIDLPKQDTELDRWSIEVSEAIDTLEDVMLAVNIDGNLGKLPRLHLASAAVRAAISISTAQVRAAFATADDGWVDLIDRPDTLRDMIEVVDSPFFDPEAESKQLSLDEWRKKNPGMGDQSLSTLKDKLNEANDR